MTPGVEDAAQAPGHRPLILVSSREGVVGQVDETDVQLIGGQTLVGVDQVKVLGSGGMLTVGDLRRTHLTSYGPDGIGIRKVTSSYYPSPKSEKKKPQHAHFTVVLYSVPPPGSVIEVLLTPAPAQDEPVIVKPM